MTAIKTYLLPLFLFLFFIPSAFTQSNLDRNESEKQDQQLSETDSILINCYFTEKEYNRIHKLNYFAEVDDSERIYEDEIYSDKKHKKRDRDKFVNDIPIELVEVVLNTLFFIAILWQ